MSIGDSLQCCEANLTGQKFQYMQAFLGQGILFINLPCLEVTLVSSYRVPTLKLFIYAFLYMLGHLRSSKFLYHFFKCPQ